MVTLLTRLDWLKRYRKRPCPTHGGTIANSTYMLTAWCPTCHQEWWVRRQRDLNAKARWGYKMHNGSE